MAFQLSPGINVSEIDLTTVIPSVATSVGAFAGNFAWGPVDEVVTISNEIRLVERFGKPTNTNYEHWFSAANFLAYSNTLRVVRAANNATLNATANANVSVTGVGIQIKNEDQYESTYSSGSSNLFAAKYPGVLGNSLRVEIADSNTFSGWTYADNFTSAPSTSTYAASKNGANDELHIVVVDAGAQFTGTANTVLETFAFVSKASDAKNFDGSSNYYKDVLNSRSKYIWWLGHPTNTFRPITNITANTSSYSPDGNVYLTFSGSSTITANAQIKVNSVTNQIVSVTLNNGGLYSEKPTITATNANVSFTVTLADSDWGTDSSGNDYQILNSRIVRQFAGGSEVTPSSSDITRAYDQVANPDSVDVSLIISGPASSAVANHLISNIAEVRKDCLVFVSPEKADVVDNYGDESTDVLAFAENVNKSSFAVMDSGWKYQYDKYSDVYRWVPLNADTAGLCARTDLERDPWFSPGGLNRGVIKNVVKLAWNPAKAERDDLYVKGINPVVTFQGEGTVLFGDKTLQNKPSAFDRINVRRLFIVLEKTIARAARSTLFEFNDQFTRAQFVNLVEPYLRDVQGRRGITDFRVVCDETNNTPEVIDRNEFVGDIYIKPARSINFIQLNFVAVRSGVSFDEIVGRF